MTYAITHFKPNPTIHGYTLIIEQEFEFGGPFPTIIIQTGSIKGSMSNWVKFQKCVENEVKEREERERGAKP